MTCDAEWQLRQALVRGEKLLWSGRPPAKIPFQLEDLFDLIVGLVWLSLTLIWESVAILSGVVLMILWGIPFVLIGIHLTFGRFFPDRGARAPTAYGLTAHRVIIVRGVSRLAVRSYPFSNLCDLQLTEHCDGTGTIEFASAKLERIADARDLYERIVALQARDPERATAATDVDTEFPHLYTEEPSE